ncbi:twin-arginine translocase subunit TatC [Rhodocytophaga rosea]|uniref:Sec-independent protein translocase protein TatC n=2 Tax=Rhodocytophaga rosea TaxID=2704465 RepID=A0A6C0GWC1_9BACT|nr:twin-arginine translocase subunit TatC [Rhodocytophaga rosea]
MISSIIKRNPKQKPPQEEEKEMSFIDHLEELRWHVVRSVAAIFVFSFLAFSNKELVFGKIIMGPSKPTFWTYRMFCELGRKMSSDALCIDKLNFVIQARELSEQFTMHLASSLVIGLVLAFPYAFWEMWRFIKPGLHPTERRMTTGATFFVSLLFLMGVTFGYLIVTPLSINFLSSYQLDESIVNEFNISSYISTLVTLTLGCGIMFQLPMLAFVLSKMGIITPSLMRSYRKHSIVVILIVAAIITPPDVISQILVAMPLFLLYEVSILISARVERARLKEMNTEL